MRTKTKTKTDKAKAKTTENKLRTSINIFRTDTHTTDYSKYVFCYNPPLFKLIQTSESVTNKHTKTHKNFSPAPGLAIGNGYDTEQTQQTHTNNTHYSIIIIDDTQYTMISHTIH